MAGSVSVAPGGTFSPGNPLGILNIGSDLTLASGGTSRFEVQHSPLTNNSANVSGILVEGGTLIVTNVGASALTNGDSFTLFSAGNYSGSFAGFVLPPLTGNLVWNTNALINSGVLTVVAPASPAIGGASIDVNGNLVLSGTGAPADWTYYVLSSTNMSLPLAQWTPIATNQTDGDGNFSVTNGVDLNLPQSFLILQFQ